MYISLFCSIIKSRYTWSVCKTLYINVSMMYKYRLICGVDDRFWYYIPSLTRPISKFIKHWTMSVIEFRFLFLFYSSLRTRNETGTGALRRYDDLQWYPIYIYILHDKRYMYYVCKRGDDISHSALRVDAVVWWFYRKYMIYFFKSDFVFYIENALMLRVLVIE